ncbi:TPA: TIGR03757 family integrating conjugative element protein [Yersinia enterocolitica]|nr:TIGR03757 family integrating conjugative element protein [Yersinia enterocolitica]
MSAAYLKTCTFILLISLTSLGIAETKETIIFTNNDNLLSDIPVSTTIYNLDAPADLVSKAFGTLSSESEIAKKHSQKIMSSKNWQQQDAALRESLKGVIKAWSLGIEKVPAIVMEGRFVVYGTTNVELAREKLKQFQGGH